MYNKLLKVGAVGVSVAAMLAGCAPIEEPKETVTKTVKQKTEPAKVYTAEDDFLLNIYMYPGDSDVLLFANDQDLLNAGWATCDVLDEGYSLDDVVYMLADTAGGDAEAAEAFGWVVGSAIAFLCPEYGYMLN